MFKLPAILLCNVLKKENGHLLCLINFKRCTIIHNVWGGLCPLRKRPLKLARHEEFSVFAQCAKRKEEELL